LTERFDVDIRLRIDPSIRRTHIAEGMTSETDSIWRPYGLRLHWTDASASVPHGLSLEAIVERQFEVGRDMRGRETLGLAIVGLDAPDWRPIRVSFDATKDLLTNRSAIDGAPPGGIVLDQELARALGRVLAHEIGHVLIGTPSHDRQGLMRPSYNAWELANPDRRPFRLTCGAADRFAHRLPELTRAARLAPQEAPALLDIGALRGNTREFPVQGVSCIAIHPAQ
jgi:hypothetical protein